MSFKHWCCWYITNFIFLPFHERLPLPRGGILRKLLMFMIGGYWVIDLLDIYYGDITYHEAYDYVVFGISPP